MKHSVKTILLASSLCLPLLAASVNADEVTPTSVEPPIEVVIPATETVDPVAPIEIPTDSAVLAPTEEVAKPEPVVEVPPTPSSAPAIPIELPVETPVEKPVEVPIEKPTEESVTTTETETETKSSGSEVVTVPTLVETDTKDEKSEVTTEKSAEDKKEPSSTLALVGAAAKSTTSTSSEPVRPVTQTVITQPLVTATGQTVVGTQDSKVLVQDVDGTTRVVAPETVGAKKQADGTVAIKTKSGKLEVLPSTGEDNSTALTIAGVLAIVFGLIVAAKKSLFKSERK